MQRVNVQDRSVHPKKEKKNLRGKTVLRYGGFYSHACGRSMKLKKKEKKEKYTFTIMLQMFHNTPLKSLTFNTNWVTHISQFYITSNTL